MMMEKQPISKKALDVLTAFIQAMARREALWRIDNLDTHDLRIRWLQDISLEYARILDEQPIFAITEERIFGNGNLELRDDCERLLHVWTADELERYAQEAGSGAEIDIVAEKVADRYLADRYLSDYEDEASTMVEGMTMGPENQDAIVYAVQTEEICECDGCNVGAQIVHSNLGKANHMDRKGLMQS